MSYKLPTKAVITDAGFASRFLPITKTIPKAMIPLGPKPIMQYVVEECVAGGIKDIIIVATHDGKPIYEDYFTNPCEKIYKQLESQGKLDRFESVREVLEIANITVIEQDPTFPYGNGSPIASAKPYLKDDEAFIALYSDDLIFTSKNNIMFTDNCATSDRMYTDLIFCSRTTFRVSIINIIHFTVFCSCNRICQ